MALHIVVEGVADKTFLERILRDPLAGVDGEIRAGYGKSSAESLARSLLVVRREPVALVLDADTVEPSLVGEQAQYYESALRRVATTAGYFHVCLLEPSLETVAFTNPGILADLFPEQDISELDLTEARYAPKLVLQRLLGAEVPNPLNGLTERLTDAAVEHLQSHPAMVELIAFIRKFRNDQAVA